MQLRNHLGGVMGDERDASMAAMEAIAPIFDSLESAINSQGPVDMVEAYFIALKALREVGMDKATLERFVAVLMADRTHHAISS
jgi:hypothetical protein